MKIIVDSSSNEHRSFLFLLLILFITCVSGNIQAGSVPPKNLHISADRAGASSSMAICSVDAAVIKHSVNKGIFGTNVEWIDCGNGIWNSDKRKPDERYVELAKEQGISLVRFPGGTFSDFYHWTDGIGPVNLRPVRPHFTDAGESRNCFGTSEFMQFCRAIGAQPLITVNAGTGTPEEAASWVRYCNYVLNKRRISDGLAEPMRVHLWEVGNELYLSGSETEKKITISPEEYAKRFINFATAMKKADPTISIAAIGVAHSYNVPFGPYSDWNEVLLNKASRLIDYLSLHDAYFPVLIGEYPDNPEDIYRAMWAAPMAIDSDLELIEKFLSRYQKDKPIGIAVTEWGPFFSITDPKWIDQNKTLGSAVYVGLVLQVFIKHPKVKIASYFKFTDRSFMGWVSHDQKPKVPFYAFKMFTKHFGSFVVESHITCDKYNSKKIGFVKRMENVPELSVISSLSRLKDKLYVNIISRCVKKTYRVVFDIKGFNLAKSGATVWQLSGESVFSNNGRDLPTEWGIKYEEPMPLGGTEIRIMKYKCKPEDILQVPPHSVVTVEFSKGEGQN